MSRMRPLDRYRKEKRAERNAELVAVREASTQTDPGLQGINGEAECLSLKGRFRMPDGSTVELEGVWDSVKHLDLTLTARNMQERAAIRAREILIRMGDA